MPENNKILIVGATGFLGQTLAQFAPSEWECVWGSRRGHGHIPIDLTDGRSVASTLASVRPKWVINTAAMTSVDGCERDPDQARTVHVTGTEYLVRACEEADCGLITLSTNYVFAAESGLYHEGDLPNPPNVYGQTKLEGEARVLAADCRGIVIRTAVLYGHRPGSRPNFVTWAIGALQKGETLRVVTDEWSNPTYVNDLSSFIWGLCHSDFEGVVHYAGRDFLTRYEMVMHICNRFGFDIDRVIPTTSASFGQPAKRPLRAGLCTELAQSLSESRPTRFDDALSEIQKAIH